MKKLFIYYSLTGSGDVVAEELKKQGYEIRKVVEKKKMPKTFFFCVMSGGFRAMMNKRAKLIDYDNDVSSYEEIIIGSPIWNGRLTPAANTILDQTKLNDKKLTFIFCSGSGEGPNALKKVNKLFPNAKVIFLKEPKKNKDELLKIKNL